MVYGRTFLCCGNAMTQYPSQSFCRVTLGNGDMLKMWPAVLQMNENAPVRALHLANHLFSVAILTKITGVNHYENTKDHFLEEKCPADALELILLAQVILLTWQDNLKMTDTYIEVPFWACMSDKYTVNIAAMSGNSPVGLFCRCFTITGYCSVVNWLQTSLSLLKI